MTRLYCKQCAYPERTCLCRAVTKVSYRTRIVVLQHPSESRHAKNTARIISLVIPDTETVVGETAGDFRDVRNRFQSDPTAIVLYPAAISTPLKESVDRETINTIIIIDGTWRKAKKIWLSNPWLHTMRVCDINDANSSLYNIRSGSNPNGLASIEAAAFALSQLEEASTKPLLEAFMAMQKQWLQFER